MGHGSLQRWHAAFAEATRRPVRVVVVADSMGEQSAGYQDVWTAFHEAVTLGPRGAWYPPRAGDGAFGWHLLPGSPADIGIEARGQVLRSGDGPAGVTAPAAVPTTLDVHYTARPDGARLEVRLDGATTATIDTSLDERGRPVTGAVRCQRWRSPHVGSVVTWQLEAVGPGAAAVEAVAMPPVVGLEVHGTGRSGHATRSLLDAGYALAHLEAMVARGEPPDLVVWAADTADQRDTFDGSALEEALDATRRIAPAAAVAHYIPTAHNGRPDWPARVERFRAIDEQRDVIVLDGYAALGDVSIGAPGARYATDGVHLNPEGRAMMTEAWIEALAPAPLSPIPPTAPWHRALAESGERAVRVVVVDFYLGEGFVFLAAVWEHLRAEATVVGRRAALERLAAMAARGEAPDLVVWTADAEPSEDVLGELAAVGEAIARTRLALPDATIVQYVPPARGQRQDRPDWMVWYRGIAAAFRACVVDGPGALAAAGRSGTDRVGIVEQAFLAALAPPAT